jgi:hypothetical protein
MSVTRFHLVSALTPAEVMSVLTDFSPARAQNWPSIDSAHFTVHARGDNWAEVTEGTAAAWERSRYEWDADRQRVTVSTHESKVSASAAVGCFSSRRMAAALGSTWS